MTEVSVISVRLSFWVNGLPLILLFALASLSFFCLMDLGPAKLMLRLVAALRF